MMHVNARSRTARTQKNIETAPGKTVYIVSCSLKFERVTGYPVTGYLVGLTARELWWPRRVLRSYYHRCFIKCVSATRTLSSTVCDFGRAGDRGQSYDLPLWLLLFLLLVVVIYYVQRTTKRAGGNRNKLWCLVCPRRQIAAADVHACLRLFRVGNRMRIRF